MSTVSKMQQSLPVINFSFKKGGTDFFLKITYVEDVPDLLDPVHDNIFMSGPGDQPNSSAESDHSGQIGET